VTAAEIARLRGLLAGATPGPWEFDREAGEITGYRASERWLCGGVWNGDDGEAIVAAVNSLPSLLDAVEAERARAETAEASSEAWRTRYMGCAGALRSFLTTQAQTPKVVETIRALERDLGWTSPLLGESREGEVGT